MEYLQVFDNNKNMLDEKLLRAAEGGNIEEISLLLERGANIDAADGDGWTALMLAAKSGHTGAVRLLLERGANIHATNKNGWQAAGIALMYGCEEIGDILFQAIDTPVGLSGSALMIVVSLYR